MSSGSEGGVKAPPHRREQGQDKRTNQKKNLYLANLLLVHPHFIFVKSVVQNFKIRDVLPICQGTTSQVYFVPVLPLALCLIDPSSLPQTKK